MDPGSLIDNYLDIIRFDDNYNLYISRKSIKHFVESRKKEMSETHTKDEVFNKLYFAIDNVILTYSTFDKLTPKDSNRFIYVKYFENLKMIKLRIVLELVDDRLEVCSIHFQKHK
jgi:hypothetical protein